MKKHGFIFLLVLCVAFMSFLGACKTEDKKENYETVPVLEEVRPEEEKMNTFTDLNGNEVTYNMNTRRIVALSGAGDLVAFGIRPLAVSGSTTTSGYESFFKGVDLLDYNTPFNAEEILSYKPELILVYQNMEQDNIDKLTKIAPVIPLYRESFDFEVRLGYIGEIFGLEENAETLIEYAEHVKETQLAKIEGMGIKDKTVSIFYYAQGVSIPPTDSWYFNKIIYDYLGMKRLPIAEEFLENADNPFTPISNESLRNYEGDIVIYADLSAAGLEPEIPEILQTNPGWKTLTAVRENRVGVIDATLYTEKDVLYLQAQYDGIIKAFEKATAK